MSPNPKDDDVIATKNRILAEVRAGRVPALSDVENLGDWTEKQAARLRRMIFTGRRAAEERGE